MSNIRGLDFTTKIIVIVFVITISFFVLFLGLSQVLVENDSDFNNGMMMGNMHPTNPDYTVAILLAITIALIAGVLVSLWIKPTRTPPQPVAAAPVDNLEIIKQALSDDEKAVLDEIKRAGEITQDSLRFRLDWSKPKLSRILTNLDKMNVIQRERYGKTYKVFIAKKRSET
jgi:hypothetical protein